MDMCGIHHTKSPRTRRMHHPSMHSKFTSIPYTSWISLATVCIVFFCVSCGCACVDSLLVNKGMGCGSSWSSLDLETLESDVSSASRRVPSPRTVGGQAAVFVTVLLQSNGEILLHVMLVVLKERRLTPELLDEIREFFDEECGRISVNIVSNRFTLSKGSPLLRLRPVGDPYWRTVTSVIVASSPRRCWRGWRLIGETHRAGRFHRVDA